MRIHQNMRIKEISEKVQKTSSKTLVIQNNLIPLFHNNQEKRFTSNYTKKATCAALNVFTTE